MNNIVFHPVFRIRNDSYRYAFKKGEGWALYKLVYSTSELYWKRISQFYKNLSTLRKQFPDLFKDKLIGDYDENSIFYP